MSRTLSTIVSSVHKGFTLVGSVGKHGELLSASWYRGERCIVSLSGDMHHIDKFDGLWALNIQGELGQLVGVVLHGDVYPYTWKTLSDAVIKSLHLAVGKGRATRVLINSLVIRGSVVWWGDQRVFWKHNENVFLGEVLGDPLLGQDETVLRKQGAVLYNLLSQRASKASIKFIHKARLVGKGALSTPWVPLTV